jgi:hypothetical protein
MSFSSGVCGRDAPRLGLLSVRGEAKGGRAESLVRCLSENLGGHERNFTGNLRLTRETRVSLGGRGGFLGTPGREDDFPRASEGFGGSPRRPERLEPERVKAEQEPLHKTEGGGGRARSCADDRSSSRKPPRKILRSDGEESGRRRWRRRSGRPEAAGRADVRRRAERSGELLSRRRGRAPARKDGLPLSGGGERRGGRGAGEEEEDGQVGR